MHIDNKDAEFLEELENKGVNAEVITQPANSSDTNLLICFFVVLSANDGVAEGEGEMIQHIQQNFNQYLRQNINRAWLTYTVCLSMIIKHLGDNDYKNPHINEDKMEWEGTLPMVFM